MFCISYHKMCLFTGVSLDTLVVIQSPDVSVMEGETVNITCCWTEMFERVWVHWRKNGITIRRQVLHNKAQESLKKDTNNCSSLTFPNITRNDSGRYICRVFVEIPLPVERNGTGTLVTWPHTKLLQQWIV
uniref:Ig-like domain-containing protein n=1 Tax=Acanthochromis polyacanthus TaxID=80966 RepID=A0A3Q1FIZ6_9TELE